MTTEKLSEHYEFVSNPDPKQMSRIRLVKTPYTGVIYAYGNVAPKVIDGEPIISYIYEVYENPRNLNLDNDKEFKILISDILHEVLNVAFKEV